MNLFHARQIRLVCCGLAGFTGLLSALSVMAGSMVLPGGAGIYTVGVTSFREAKFKTVYVQEQLKVKVLK